MTACCGVARIYQRCVNIYVDDAPRIELVDAALHNASVKMIMEIHARRR